MQETKVDSVTQLEDFILHVDGYESFWCFSRGRKGHSGVVTYVKVGLTKHASDQCGNSELDKEGRMVITDHESFVLFNCYFPNSGMGEHRASVKDTFNELVFVKAHELLAQGRNVIIAGDFNVCHKAVDTFRPDVRNWNKETMMMMMMK
jgi:exodeoxyribonuclease-3